jgi:hypothetical protein
LPDPPGSFDLCDICFWEDDLVQLVFPTLAGGANRESLANAQRNFAEFGACERRHDSDVRAATPADVRDPSWRPFDRSVDPHLEWTKRQDHDRWQRLKDDPSRCLYYWREEYWLRRSAAADAPKNDGSIP